MRWSTALVMNWVLDPKYMPLAREPRILVDQYLDQVRATPQQRSPGSGAVRKAVLGTVQRD